MKAIITGASSGLGADIARILGNMGYDLILVARRKTKLEKLLKREWNLDRILMAQKDSCRLKIQCMYKIVWDQT